MKKILVTKAALPSYEEYCNEIKSIWDTSFLTNNGAKHQLLEAKITEFLGVKNTSLFTNGHLALYVALKSLKLQGEVITTPFTFASTTNAIIENGLVPVFCDINPIDYTIDTNKIEALITEKTCAIMPVHVYGNICDVEAIEKIAIKYGLKVIYDAAHAFGVKYKEQSICNYGDISMLSFHATKVFNTIEGGALIYPNRENYLRFKSLKNFGLDDDGKMVEESINAKMNEFQAAMGLCNLKYISSDIKKRKTIALKYNSLLSNVTGIRVNNKQADVISNYAYYPILIEPDKYKNTAAEICEKLKEKEIFGRRYFYPLITDYDFYKNIGYETKTTPTAKYISDNILCLPMYSDLSLEDVEVICKLILE